MGSCGRRDLRHRKRAAANQFLHYLGGYGDGERLSEPVQRWAVGDGEIDQEKATIRDHFDVFLDYLSHFEHFIQAGLVKPNDIRPYLEYWTNALAGNDQIDPALLTYFWRFVDVYGYSKARFREHGW